MKTWILIFFLPVFNGHAVPLNCTPVDGQGLDQQVQRINQRYDDFFRDRRAREERAERANQGSEQVKIQQEIRAKEMERARQAYKATPKDRAKEEALRMAWEAEQKDRDKRMELARLCEVQQRAKADELLKKGRAIPDLKEFDLEE